MEAILGWLFIIGLLFGIIAGLIGHKKDRGFLGFVLGFMLGPFGILIILLIRGSRRNCPYCKELIQHTATVCPHCQKESKTTAPAKWCNPRAAEKMLKSELKKFK